MTSKTYSLKLNYHSQLTTLSLTVQSNFLRLNNYSQKYPTSIYSINLVIFTLVLKANRLWHSNRNIITWNTNICKCFENYTLKARLNDHCLQWNLNSTTTFTPQNTGNYNAIFIKVVIRFSYSICWPKQT